MAQERNDDAEFFGPLGLDRDAERRYAEIAEGRHHDADPETLTRLIDVGLVRIEDGTPVVLPVRLAVERWAADREAEIRRARTGADRFAEQEASLGPSLVETLTGVAAVGHALNQLQASARELVRCFDREPYFSDPLTISEEQEPASSRGVQYQVVYRQSALAHPQVLTSVRQARALGEDARVFPELPIRMLISDDRMALLILAQDRADGPLEPDDVDGLVIHPSPLLDAMIQLFTTFWNLAIPVELSSQFAVEGDEPHREVLRLLATGLTDASIARELGISERTVHRRIGRLQQMLGANSRFLLGVQASRRGWI